MEISLKTLNKNKKQVFRLGKHAYTHHEQMGLTFPSNQITLIDEYYDRVNP
jgi:hypothetical protein